MKFKDYEYGFYGFHCSHRSYWMNSEDCVSFVQKHNPPRNYIDLNNHYKQKRANALKQLPKIQTVVFIYGDYKECV